MSKGGAQRKQKQAEVMERIEEAAEKKLLEDTLAEQQVEIEKMQRLQRLHAMCHHHTRINTGGVYSLSGEMLGVHLAEAWMQTAYQQMLQRALAQRAAGDEVKPGDIRLASPLIVPG